MKKEQNEIEYEGKKYEVKYLHEGRYGERGELTVAYIELNDNTQLIGVSERSPVDRYDKQQGRLIAFGRLQKKIRKRKKQKEIILKKVK